MVEALYGHRSRRQGRLTEIRRFDTAEEPCLESKSGPRFVRPGSLPYIVLSMIRGVLQPTIVVELLGITLILYLAFRVPPDAVHSSTALIIIVLFAIGLTHCLRIRRNRVAHLLNIRLLLRGVAHEVFGAAPWCRVTWFRLDPMLRSVLVPYARYSSLHPSHGPSPRSKAYYPLGVSYTGLAGKYPGRYFIYECPAFNGRGDMIRHYVNVLRVPEQIARKVSNTMVATRCVFTYGIQVDAPEPLLLGVLSVDLPVEVERAVYERRFLDDRFRILVAALSQIEATSRRISI